MWTTKVAIKKKHSKHLAAADGMRTSSWCSGAAGGLHHLPIKIIDVLHSVHPQQEGEDPPLMLAMEITTDMARESFLSFATPPTTPRPVGHGTSWHKNVRRCRICRRRQAEHERAQRTTAHTHQIYLKPQHSLELPYLGFTVLSQPAQEVQQPGRPSKPRGLPRFQPTPSTNYS